MLEERAFLLWDQHTPENSFERYTWALSPTCDENGPPDPYGGENGIVACLDVSLGLQLLRRSWPSLPLSVFTRADVAPRLSLPAPSPPSTPSFST